MHPSSTENDGIISAIVHDNIVSGVTTRLIADDMRALAHAIGYPESHLVMIKQVHGDVIHVVTSPIEDAQLLIGDGLITTQKGIILCVRVADCAGVLLWDERTSTVAAVHSGWRGTRENIVGKCLRVMQESFGCDPATIRVFISPCASGDAYEVREDVARFFPNDVVLVDAERQVWLFDNRSAIQSQLASSGIPAAQVCVDPSCTIADGRFHSYRRDGSAAGRCVAYIGLRSFETLVPL